LLTGTISLFKSNHAKVKALSFINLKTISLKNIDTILSCTWKGILLVVGVDCAAGKLFVPTYETPQLYPV
jgi:hypothetical protein